MTGVLVVLAGVLGLAVGSFLNVVIWRVPRGESVVRPPSACPACGHPIRPWDNVPVASWLVLRGKCRDCAAPISARYPLVEAATCVVFAAVAAWQGVNGALPAWLYLAAVSIALAMIDLDTRRLPDAIVLPSYAVAAALLVLGVLLPGGSAQWSDLLRGLAGGLVLFAVYVLLAVVKPGGMGMGDVKLSGLLGLYLGTIGWGAVVVGWFAAFLLGGLFSVVLLALRRAGRSSRIPFGPWMLAGAWVGAVGGQSVWSAYLGLM